jgi:UDP-N-acetyl-D-glucosamine dehydrogenase
MSVNNLFKYDIAVIGLGYVGLPLIITAAKAGMKCLGIDINDKTIKALNNQSSHIERVKNDDLLICKENIKFDNLYSEIGDVGTIVLCVPTPLRDGDPYTGYIDSVIDNIGNKVKNQQTIILESTTYPKHTFNIAKEIEGKTNLSVGKDFYVCFSPEREDPGNKSWDTKTTPKIVGGVTQECTNKGYTFYRNFIDTIVKCKSSTSAELTKLLENSQRLINIAFMNEFKIICEELDEDINHIIDLAITKPFGFNEYRSGPGIGGHCIPIDPFYLQWKYKEFNSISYLIDASKKAEDRNRKIIINKLTNHITNKCNNPSEVLYLGLTYKPNVSDVRSSAAYEIAIELNKNFKGINFYDPLISNKSDLKEIELTENITEVLNSITTVVIMVNHNTFDFNALVKNAYYIFDSQNISDLSKTNKEVFLL